MCCFWPPKMKLTTKRVPLEESTSVSRWPMHSQVSYQWFHSKISNRIGVSQKQKSRIWHKMDQKRSNLTLKRTQITLKPSGKADFVWIKAAAAGEVHVAGPGAALLSQPSTAPGGSHHHGVDEGRHHLKSWSWIAGWFSLKCFLEWWLKNMTTSPFWNINELQTS